MAKASGRCGLLRSRLPLRDLPLPLVLDTFNCYVMPIFQYGLALWISSCSNASRQSANAVFTKYLKAYLGVPYHSNNSIVHYLTHTTPLIQTLQNSIARLTGSFSFPSCFHGYRPSFLEQVPAPEVYDPIPLIPTITTLPSLSWNRKKVCRELLDINHQNLCATQNFHTIDYNTCLCLGCGEAMSHYHEYFCNALTS